MNDEALVDQEPTTAIKEYSPIEAALTELREKHGKTVFDLTTTAGLKEAKAARAEIRGYRTGLETKRKAVKAPVLQRAKDIDAEAVRITAELSALENPIDAQIKKREAEIAKEKQDAIDAEAKRVSALQERLTELRGAVAAVNSMGSPRSERVQEFINDITAIPVDETFEEFLDQATIAKAETLLTLNNLLTAAGEREAEAERIKAEREELDRLRAEAEQREAAEKEAREAEEAAAKARRDAEEAAAAEVRRQEQEKFDDQRKKQEEQQAELDAEAERQEAERQRIKKEVDDAAEAERQRQELERGKEREAKLQKEKAAEAAKRNEYPGAQAILEALAAYFEVEVEVAAKWLTKLKGEKS